MSALAAFAAAVAAGVVTHLICKWLDSEDKK